MAYENDLKDELKDLLKERSKVLKLAQEQPPGLQALLNEHFIDNDFKSRMSRLGAKIRYPIISRLYKNRFQESIKQATRDVFEKYIPHVTNKLTGDDDDEYHSILYAYEAVIRNCKAKTISWNWVKAFRFCLISYILYTLLIPTRERTIELLNLFYVIFSDSRNDARRELLANHSLQITLIFTVLIPLLSLIPLGALYFIDKGFRYRSTELTISLYETHNIFDIFYDPESKKYDRALFEQYPSRFEKIENSLDRKFGIEKKKPLDPLIIRDFLIFLTSVLFCIQILALMIIVLFLVIIFSTHEIFNFEFQLRMAIYLAIVTWTFSTALRGLIDASYRWKLRNKQYESRKQLQHN